MTNLFSFLILINADFVFGLSSPGSTSTTKYASNSPEKNFHSDAALLHQILTQETTLRMELERNVRDLIKQFELLKKGQAAAETEISILKQAKIDQDALNQQLLTNITKLTKENDNLKDAISYHQQHVNVSSNSIPIPGQTVCQCDFANITKEIQNFKREIRYISLSFMDLERETEAMNSNILQNVNTSANLINQELLQITVSFQNFSTGYEQDKYHQAYINADLKDQQRNVSNTIKDHIDSEVLNLRTKYFELENKNNELTSSIKGIESFLSKVDVFMNDTWGLQRSFLRMQHEEIQTSKDISDIIRNITAMQDLVGTSDVVAFSATITSEITPSSGQTLVFPRVLCNVGGGYNNKDGIFTAPVDGTYVFFVRITPSSNPSDMYFSIVLNGVEEAKHLVYGRDRIPFRISTNTIALQLNHSDRIWVKINTGGRIWSSGTHSGDQTFTGYKV